VYLKREHVVGRKVKLRNWRAGFGWVSRCEREAATLKRLEAARLPGPQWLAYGTDAAGRAFLLVDEVPGAADLRDTLGDGGLSPADRRALAERVGRTLADLHDAGFGTPELAAKHLLVHPRDHGVTFVGWGTSAPLREGRLPALPGAARDYYADDVWERRTASPAADLVTLARSVARVLGGDPSRGSVPSSVPEPLADLVIEYAGRRSCEAVAADAWALKEQVTEASRAAFGPDRYVKFTMPG
jgi:hypothetical protein